MYACLHVGKGRHIHHVSHVLHTDLLRGGARSRSDNQLPIEVISKTHMDSWSFTGIEFGGDVITQELGLSRMILVFPRGFHVALRAGSDAVTSPGCSGPKDLWSIGPRFTV